MRWLKRGLLGLGAVLLVLVAIMIVRALTLESRQLPREAAAELNIDLPAAAGRLAGALRIATVSRAAPAEIDPAPFRELHAYLERTFPRVHKALERETVGGLSLLYTWKGEDPAKPGLLLLAHQDVVPINPGTEADWQRGPFSGAIADGFVWGRGALDTKNTLVAMLEAVELLLARGYQPPRTVVLAFGHDEEVGGRAGAAKLAEALRARGMHFELSLDEGLPLTEGIMPGVTAPVATVGIAEKGFVSVALEVEGAEGHSSMPPAETAAAIVSRAVVRLTDHPFPARISGPSRRMFEYLAPEASFGLRLALANLWLLEPAIRVTLAAKVTTDATQRTTTAPTMLEGSAQANVLPKKARAVVNFRILPGETVESVLARVREVVDDPRVRVAPTGEFLSDPSRVSSAESPAFRLIQRTVGKIAPEAIVVPALVVGATDSRYYSELAADLYRFAPYRFGPEDRARIHGTNERISLESYGELVAFYANLLLALD